MRGGVFQNIGGQVRQSLAALNTTDGAAIPGWAPSLNASSEVYSLAVSNGSLYVGGFFWNIGGLSRANLASFDAGTGSLTYWNPHVVGEVQALALRQGILYAGGNIDSIGGNNSAWGAYTHFNFVQFGPGNFQADFDGDGETDVSAFHHPSEQFFTNMQAILVNTAGRSRLLSFGLGLRRRRDYRGFHLSHPH